MADSKISELNELDATTVANADQVPIVDNSASETKRISVTQLKKIFGTTVTGSPSSPEAVTTQIPKTTYAGHEIVYVTGSPTTSVTLTGSPKIAAGSNDGDILEVFNFTSHVVKISMTSGVNGPGQLELGTGYNQWARFVWVDSNSEWWNTERSDG